MILLVPMQFHPMKAADFEFRRGDVNGDSVIDLTDVIDLLGYLYLSEIDEYEIPCLEAADSNDDGSIDLSDAVALIFYLYEIFTVLPPPDTCGTDPTPDLLGCTEYLPCGNPSFLTNGVGLKMIYIPPGAFLMGSPLDERGRNCDNNFTDEALHKVNITAGFYISETEVTQEQYHRLMNINPSFYNGRQGGIDWGINLGRPVDSVSWNDAQSFCKRLGDLDDCLYRLPREAEWEYACRAGTTTRFWFGDALGCKDEGFAPLCDEIADYVWQPIEFITKGTEEVKTKLPNPWGLHDMHDNVDEMCQDWYGDYAPGEAVDPTGPGEGQYKVLRGSGSQSLCCGRSAWRGIIDLKGTSLHVGFRIVRPIPKIKSPD